MPHKNLDGSWGESRAMTVRLTPYDRDALRTLTERWACTPSEAIRRAVAHASESGVVVPRRRRRGEHADN